MPFILIILIRFRNNEESSNVDINFRILDLISVIDFSGDLWKRKLKT